ncbi:hypothetical protein JIN85_19195 [Luteolibacter pohnpeiensis]|uniref:3-methyladenine DNA glycosylase n=1 Tax=Luteolibacter pohnpeiensis TaxID=454153 RepID=A0A934SBM5_9BACT|nr:hypothetical protein [Luteolibacter pohnpeiensis]MBK1884551.1 hypothetical protein [Luteolibacter pohnpeiensis]
MQRRHLQRASTYTAPARARRDRGIAHPIDDFLFQYYPYPFAFLESWQPGFGLVLEWDADEPPIRLGKYHRCLENRIFVDPGLLNEKEIIRLRWIHDLLAATQSRPGHFGCHGLHEWAMVYGGTSVRHEKTTPLRLPQAEIDEVVRSRPIVCSHYDAFRFFEPETKPWNRLQPSLESRPKLEQPGCIHANMDLYKWAAKAMPWIGSELLLDCFELAIDLRDLDMRASPYDLSAWDRPAVKIETAEGRKHYESEQRRLAERAAPLRHRLISALAAVLDAAAQSATSAHTEAHSPCQ